MTENAHRCVYCGASLAGEAIVCDNCGKPVDIPRPTPSAPLPFTPPFISDFPPTEQPAEQLNPTPRPEARSFYPPPIEQAYAAPLPQPLQQAYPRLPEQPYPAPQPQAAQPAVPPPAHPAQPYKLTRIQRTQHLPAPPAVQAQPPTQPTAPARKGGSGLPIILGGVGLVGVVCVGIIVAAAVFFVRTGSAGASIVPPLAGTQLSSLAATSTPTRAPAPTKEAPVEELPAAPSEAGSTGANDGTWSVDIGQQLSDTYIAENFANNDNGWSESSDDNRSWAYEDQRYALHIKTGDYVAWAYLPVDFTPQVIGFDAALAPGLEQGAYGVLCYYQDKDNYHYVAIDPVNQEYGIGKFINNEDTMLLDDWWVPAAHMQTSPDAVNRIKVVCLPDKISLYINDQLETEVAVGPAAAGRAAVYAETWEDMPAEGFKVLFDNLYANLQAQ